MRVGILSDTHGFLDPQIIDIVHDGDLAVHAGDIGNAHVPGGYVVAVHGRHNVGRPARSRSSVFRPGTTADRCL